jgi:hypothetical protein
MLLCWLLPVVLLVRAGCALPLPPLLVLLLP